MERYNHIEQKEITDFSKNSKKTKRKLGLVLILLFLGMIALLGSSYAIFSRNIMGSKHLSLLGGNFQVTFHEGQNITLSNISTMSLNEATTTTPYEFTVENEGDIDAYYRVYFLDEGTVDTDAQVSKDYLGYSLNGTDGTSIRGVLSDLGSSLDLIRAKRLSKGSKVRYTLRIWLTDNAPNSEMGKSYRSKIGIDSIQTTNTFADYLIAKANQEGVSYFDGNMKEMYTYHQNATSYLSRLIEYRYIGNQPYNYVLFNGELWRIVGVFETETQGYHPKVKMVREAGTLSGYGSSNVTPTFLNSVAYFNQLQEGSRKMVAEVPAYLGTVSPGASASTLYTLERSQNKVTGNGPLRSVIHLLYASDYAYTFASGYQNACFQNPFSCTNTSWMNLEGEEALLSPVSNTIDQVYSISTTGSLVSKDVSTSVITRPVVYLDASTMLRSGDGSKQNPYQLYE